SVLGIIGLLYIPVLRHLLKDKTSYTFQRDELRHHKLSSSLREVMFIPGFLTMAAVFMGSSIGGWIAFTWMPLYLYEQFNMSLTSSGFSATFYMQFGSLSGILAGGWFADQWTQRTNRGRLLTQGFGLILAAPFL